MVILIDSREQKADHIIKYLNDHNVDRQQKKLDYGDYSFILPADPELGIMRDLYFNDRICIERKASLEELSGNLAQKRQQFENELIRSNNVKLVLMIENKDGYKNIVNGQYDTAYNPKAYLASLLTFQHRYNIIIQFIDPDYSGQFIRYEFYYYLREYLK